MSFSNFLRCCFPKSREQATADHEENVPDVSFVSEEKKLDCSTKARKEEEIDTYVKSKNANKELTMSSNSAYLDHKKQDQFSGTFTSFGGVKKDLSSPVKTHPESLTGGTKETTKKETLDINIDKDIIPSNKVEVNEHSGNGGQPIQNGHKKSSNALQNNLNNSVVSKNKKADETFDICNSQRIITDGEIKNAPQLIFEEIQGDMLKNNKLIINAAGLSTGLRKARDGLVFFGTPGKNKDDHFLNDVELNCAELDINSNRMFYIYYKKETNKYYLKNYNKTKVKMHIKLRSEYFLPLLKKEIILLDELYFQLIPHSDGKLEMINLGMARVSENKKEAEICNKYIFEKNEYKTVTIGRDPKCTVSFPGDKSFSKIHTTIEYDIDKSYWKIKDGSDKPSTNGTWLFANHSFEIIDSTIFQFGTSHFLINVRE